MAGEQDIPVALATRIVALEDGFGGSDCTYHG